MNTDNDWMPLLTRNVGLVRETISAAARRAGRSAKDIRVVAVTKYAPFEVIRLLPRTGLVEFGENRVQQLIARAERLTADSPPPSVHWHMIGHLQRNKIRALLPHARTVHSLDSERLADALAEQAAQSGPPVEVFVELNVSGETSKTGASPEEAARVVERAASQVGLVLRGLMTMAPYSENPEDSRPVFARLRELLDDFRRRGIAGPSCDQLSMGMSQDYSVAVEEGATVVRIGSALFEGLPTVDPRET